MATLATVSEGGRITERGVERELERLAGNTVTTASGADGDEDEARVIRVLGAERAARLDRFDRVQLVDVLAVCARSASLSAAGRQLFAQSRAEKSSVNDADRLRKYLAKLGIEFSAVPR